MQNAEGLTQKAQSKCKIQKRLTRDAEGEMLWLVSHFGSRTFVSFEKAASQVVNNLSAYGVSCKVPEVSVLAMSRASVQH